MSEALQVTPFLIHTDCTGTESLACHQPSWIFSAGLFGLWVFVSFILREKNMKGCVEWEQPGNTRSRM